MARRKKSVTRTKKADNTALVVTGLWVIALLFAFLFLGSVMRPILWVFIFGAIATYYLLNKR